MSMAILLPVATYPDATPRAGVDHALGLAAMLGAHVSAIIQEVDIAPVHNALSEALLHVSQMATEAEAGSRARAAELDLWMRERASGLGIDLQVSTAWCRPEAFADWLVPAARYHDLTLSVLDGADAQRRAEAEMLIFGSGGPVLVVPAGARSPVDSDRPFNVVLAWDGGRAASRALRDARPLLARATMVSIVTVGDDKAIGEAGIAGVRALLDQRGIPNRHLHRERGTSPIGDTLQAVAVGEGADLLVMGAYGRNRVQEFVLGGATRAILHAPRLPILLSH